MTLKEALKQTEIATISLRTQSRLQIENEIAMNNQLIAQLKDRIQTIIKKPT